MKVILSRKGFDSGYGGSPSPVLPDGTMLSLPIPVTDPTIGYNELFYNGKTYSEIICELMGKEIKIEGEGYFPIENVSCHLDPDVRRECYERKDGWKGIFGQSNAAFTHLKNQEVGSEDVFLFFGWFRKTLLENGKLKYDPKCKGFHAIYGYLQVGEYKKINETNFEEWTLYHPHVSRGREASDLDHVFISTDQLSFMNSKLGYGVFDFSDKVILTKKGETKSKWHLPDFFKRYKISYHTENSWKVDYFQSAAKGQEFVVNADQEIVEWIKAMF